MGGLQRILVTGLAGLLVLVPGCVVVAAAAVGAAAVGVVSYDHNEAWMDFKDTMPVTWAATLRALRAQGYVVPGEPQPGPIDGIVESGAAKVVVEAHPGGYVRVRVRVGTFDTADNERRAKLLLQEVLQQMPPSK